jgi:hypothetical protein
MTFALTIAEINEIPSFTLRSGFVVNMIALNHIPLSHVLALFSLDFSLHTQIQRNLRMALAMLKKLLGWISPKPKDPLNECSICTNPISGRPNLVLSCHHARCDGCLIHVFTKAIESETSFPPKCCQPISLSAARKILPLGLAVDFERARREYMTTNRIYCHIEICLAFIPRSNIRLRRARCEDCGARTCTKCRKEYHHFGQCNENNAGLAPLLGLADRQGWKRCVKCGRMVEKAGGCNAMKQVSHPPTFKYVP